MTQSFPCRLIQNLTKKNFTQNEIRNAFKYNFFEETNTNIQSIISPNTINSIINNLDFNSSIQFQMRNYAKKSNSIPSITSLSKESFIIKNVSIDELDRQEKSQETSNINANMKNFNEKDKSKVRRKVDFSKKSASLNSIPEKSLEYNSDLELAMKSMDELRELDGMEDLDEDSKSTLSYEKSIESKSNVKDYPIFVQAHRIPEIIDIMDGKVSCPGCGAMLQTSDENNNGFIHPKAINTYIEQEKMFRDVSNIMKNKKASTVITKPQLKILEKYHKKQHSLTCQRCHNLSHYKIIHDVEIEDYTNKLKTLKTKDVLVLYIVDVFDLENSFIENLRELIGDKDIILVVNKIDLLPTNTNETQLEVRIRKVIKSHLKLSGDSFAPPVKDIVLLSAWSKWNFKKLGDTIEKHRHYRDVYIVGKTNVGKSTLTNSLVKYFGGSIVEQTDSETQIERPFAKVTESEFPGTTLNTVSLFIGSNKNGLKQRLLDTPGLKNDNLLINYLSPKEWKFVYPRKRIVPRYVIAEPGQSLFIGGLIRIDFVSNEVYREEFKKITFVVYTSNLMPIHLTKTNKAETLIEKHLGKFLSPPSEDNTKLKMDVSSVFKFTSDTRKENAIDITLPGFGWISVNGAGSILLKVHHPSKLTLKRRDPLLPDACQYVPLKSYVSDHDFNIYKKRVQDLQRKQEKKKEFKISLKSKSNSL